MGPLVRDVLTGSASESARNLPGLEHNIRAQWINPRDTLSILLLVGGDVVQRAIAQLSGPWIAPVCFSFGWVAYAFIALLGVVSENRLMPDPDYPAMVINTKNGYGRTNQSWVIGRLLRDLHHWIDNEPKQQLATLLKKAQADENERVRKINDDLKPGDRKEIPEQKLKQGLCISVYESVPDPGKSITSFHKDILFWSGFVITIVQLGIAAIPCGLYLEWEILLIAGAGAFLAYGSGMLPQWSREKWACRKFSASSEPKTVAITRGNGSQHVIVIHSDKTGLDFEDLSAVEPVQHPLTIWASLVLAALWTALLITVTAIKSRTWYLIAVGGLGTLQNIFVAGYARNPKHYGISLRYRTCSVRPKVMWSIMEIELLCQKELSVNGVGESLLSEFFPGDLRSTEKDWWKLDYDSKKMLLDQGFCTKKEKAQREMLSQLPRTNP